MALIVASLLQRDAVLRSIGATSVERHTLNQK